MSKEIQALFRLLEEEELMPDEYYLGDGYKNDLKLIIEALKRNEPMKVDLETGTWVNYVEYYKCPNCTGRAVEIWHRFCPDCGQALDWSDEK